MMQNKKSALHGSFVRIVVRSEDVSSENHVSGAIVYSQIVAPYGLFVFSRRAFFVSLALLVSALFVVV